MSEAGISPQDPHPRRRVDVLDSFMSTVDTGSGAPVVFLHGNPTWSYLWRNVISRVQPVARCLTPDLVSMGESGPMPGGGYRFFDHARYLDAWFDALDLRDVTIVAHDWGCLGLHWAHRHPERVRAVACMETFVMPLSITDYPDISRPLFQALRGEPGEEIILQKNVFIERILPGSIVRTLSEAELEQYRKPWREPGEGRRPMLVWPREIPFDGEPADMVAAVAAWGQWLKESDLPKLVVLAEPGAIFSERVRAFTRTWRNHREVTVPGGHFLQEDSPTAIGDAIAAFVQSL
ncbi:MAG TPA: haloalkane dehalogenase [bacterium]|nr:haloalkane dehalogenase [bacterium]